jgi:branched-chain amino acid transport system substrate-binding protein
MTRFVYAFMLVCLVSAGCGRGANPRPILIGDFAPSRGPEKVVGDHARQGIRLAMEETAEKNFLVGGRPVQVLHPAYPADEPPNLQPEAVRLMTVEQASALLGGLDLTQVQVLGRAGQPYGAALVTPVELPPERLVENVFSVNVGLDFEAHVLAQFVRHELQADKTAIVGDGRRLASSQLADLLKRELSGQKTPLVLSLTVKSDADWPDALARIKAASVQALFYCGEVAEVARARARLQAAALKPALIVAGAGEELELLRTDRDAGQGIYAAVPFVAEAAIPQSQAFARKYQAKFAETPDPAAALAYDGIRALIESLSRAADASPAKVRAALADVNADAPLVGVTGNYTFSKSQAARRPLFVVQVEDGQLARPKRYDPESDPR